MRKPDQSTLIIGYGNTLRRDDGVGLKVATEAEKLGFSGTRSLRCHQLTPELAATIAEVDRVIFVDAGIDSDPVQLQAIQPEEATGTQMGHFCDARCSLWEPAKPSPEGRCQRQSLLALSQILYHYAPQAWLINIPAVDFDFGEQFSPLAENGITQALKIIEKLLSTETNPLG